MPDLWLLGARAQHMIWRQLNYTLYPPHYHTSIEVFFGWCPNMIDAPREVELSVGYRHFGASNLTMARGYLRIQNYIGCWCKSARLIRLCKQPHVTSAPVPSCEMTNCTPFATKCALKWGQLSVQDTASTSSNWRSRCILKSFAHWTLGRSRSRATHDDPMIIPRNNVKPSEIRIRKLNLSSTVICNNPHNF